MFRAKLKKGILFKKLIEGIKNIVDDINFDISANGISLQSMDISNTALISINLSSQGFEEYQCDKFIRIGISIPILAKALHCGGNDDSLTLFCEEEPSTLQIKFENLSKY